MRVHARAPASIGNLGVGFDILGAALDALDGPYLGDSVTIEDADAPSFVTTGPCAHLLPADPDANLVLVAARRLGVGPARITLHKGLPIGSGLGSSAASIVAAVLACDAYLGAQLSPDALLAHMGALEGWVSGGVHYDNVGPAYLGGVQLLLGEQGARALPIPSWRVVLLHPGTSVSTAAARAVLPDAVPRGVAIEHGRLVAGFVHALHSGDGALAARLLVDVLAEPWRAPLLPHLGPARAAALRAGALAAGISGSGPSMFAIADEPATAERIRRAFEPLIATPIGFSRICTVPRRGATVEVVP